MKRPAVLLTILLSIWLSTMSIFGKGNSLGSASPDFAFPKKVSQQASAQLQQALKKQEGDKVLEALINYTTAENLVNQDNIDKTLELIISTGQELTSVADRQMLNMLLANIYVKYYQTNSRSFNERSYLSTKPVEDQIMEVDEDVIMDDSDAVSSSEATSNSSSTASSVFTSDAIKQDVAYWSAKQFADTVWALIQEVLSYRDELLQVELERYAGVVTHEKHTWEYFPTVYDFIVTQSITLWNTIGTVNQPWNKIREWDDTLYRSLAKAHENDPQPEINYLMKLRDCPYKELYEKYNALDMPSCIDALIPYVEPMMYGSSIEERQKAYTLVEEALKKYPSYWKRDNLINIKNELLAQRVDVNCPQLVITGRPFKIDVTDNNTDRIIVAIYDKQKRLAFSKEINADSLKNSNKGPYELKVAIDAALDKDGTYTIVAEKDGKPKAKKYYPTVVCSSLYGMSANIGQTNFVLALNPVNGQPLEGVGVKFVHTSRRSIPDTISLGKTDMRGIAMVPQQKESQYGTFYLTDKKGGAFDFGGSIRNNSYTPSDSESATGFTSLALYRPGDILEWTFVVSVLKADGSKQLLPGETFQVKLYDANYQVVEDREFTSDDYGRVAGLWKLPDTGLTGDFHLEIMRPNSNNGIGSVYFTVSDYKMPTFKVELEPVSLSENGQTLTFKGKAVTYSGFPVSDSDVTLYFNRAVSYWRMHHVDPSSFWSTSTKTDATGNFTLEIPSQRFKEEDSWLFQVRADVVSPTGERRSGSEFFVVNKPYGIQCQIPSVVDLSGKCDFEISAVDPNGEKVDIDLDLTLFTPNNQEKVFSCALDKLDWNKLPSGEYNLEISAQDEALADPYRSRVIFYRPTDKTSPVKNALWIPKSSYTYNSSGEAEIVYALSHDNTVVSIFSVKKDGTFTDVFYPESEGFHSFKVFEDDDICQVVLCTVVEGVPSQIRVNVLPRTKEALVLKAESFRDNLIPSERENWSFKVSVGGKGVASAIMADLYNAALDQIKLHAWADFPWNSWRVNTPSLWINTSYSAKGNVYTSFFQNAQTLKTEYLIDPEFQTYGRNFGLNSGFHDYKFSRSMAMNSMKMEASSDYMMMDTAEAVEEEAAMAAPAPDAMEDGAVTTAGGAIEDDDAQADEQTKDFQFRDAETPLAFFRPLLNTDEDGNLDISFTVPNANTTWRLMLRGWTKQLQWSSLIQEFVASKPLMVQPNLPRFLRSGDVAFVESEVMNNTDSAIEADVVTELFDPQSEQVITTSTQRITIEANSSKTVSEEIITDSQQNMIGFRIKATAMISLGKDNKDQGLEGDTNVLKEVSDGEQAVIPILASRVSVTESDQFYITPEQQQETINLQPLTEKADIVLTYCDNPQWYCLTALPTLQQEPAQTSVSAAAEIYSIAIARKLLTENPALANALKGWGKAANKDSMLISMLSRNQALKIALLSSTPWVRQAQSDTERMARLTMLFNRDITDKVLATAVETLYKLKDPHGGWAWFSPESDPSLWATVSVLNLMGQLNSLGLLPEDKSLRNMISQSVKWLDSEVVDIYKNASRGGDYSYYVVVRDYFPEYPLSTGAQRVVNYTVQYVLDNWRMHSLYQKTLDASIFQNHGYGKTAKIVLESIQEYSENTPEKGTWFPSLYNNYSYGFICNTPVAVTAKILESYVKIEPSSQMIDGLRQWLILQKQAQDWGNSTTTAQVITAIFSASKAALAPAGQVLVSIDGKPVSGAYEHALTGEIEMEIPQGAHQISLQRSGQATAGWGAIMYQYESNPKSVKAASCNQLSIQKETLAQQPVTAQGAQPLWSRSSTFSKGGLSRIRLTLTVNDDLDYVMISDDRCAGFEPVDQLPQYMVSQGISFYRETKDSTTNIFVSHLPKGVYVLEYDVVANNIGNFSSGLATAQSQYAPTVVAHSAAAPIQVKP